MFHERLDHIDRALMMRNHQRQELAIKFHAGGSSERGHLRFSCHTFHRVVTSVRMALIDRFAATGEPLFHKRDFVSLCGLNLAGDFE